MKVFSKKCISLLLTGLLTVGASVAAQANAAVDFAVYAKNNLTFSGGSTAITGTAVVGNTVMGFGGGPAKRVESGTLYVKNAPEYTDPVGNGYTDPDYSKKIDNMGFLDIVDNPGEYAGNHTDYNINLKPFPDLAKKADVTTDWKGLVIEESGWYGKLEITNNGDSGLSINTKEGEIIEIRADELILKHKVTINGNGRVVFYVDRFQGDADKYVNSDGPSGKVIFYFSGDRDYTFSNLGGNFNIYIGGTTGTLTFKNGSKEIKGNIYTKGNIDVYSRIIRGFAYTASDLSLLENAKLYGKTIANNVKITGSSHVYKGDVEPLTGDVVETAPEKEKFRVTTSASAGGTITPYDEEIEEGTEIEIEATPDSGYRFVRFETDVPDIPANTSKINIKVTKAINIKAIFEEIPSEPGYKNGLLGEYFDSHEPVNETAKRVMRIDPNLAFNFLYEAPGGTQGQIEAETFSERWTGYIKVPVTGDYTFKTYSDDGVKLVINNEQLINRWGLVSLDFTISNPIHLEEGKLYPVTLEHQQMPLYSAVFLFWEAEGVPMQIVPPEAFYVEESVYNEYSTPKFINSLERAGTGLKNRFFDGVEGLNESDAVVQYEEINLLNYEWAGGTPGNSSTLGDAFSARMTGYIEGKFTETMTLEFIVDDGIRVWFDDTLVINSWQANSDAVVTGDVNMEVGKKHKITIEYNDIGGGATCIMRWRSASQELQVIPLKYLYPGS